MSRVPGRSVEEVSIIADIRDARFAAGIACVRCGSNRVCRWGSFSGRQRYRCGACRRTFSDLTGTAAAYLKRLPVLPAFRDCMASSLSVRASARAVGVHRWTSFRWRHRLLSATLRFSTGTLGGLVEVEEGWVRCTDGGASTGLPRGLRRSRFEPEWDRSWLMLLRDRTGRAAVAFAGIRRPDRRMWSVMLHNYVDDGSTLLIRAPRMSALALAGRDNGLHALDCKRLAPRGVTVPLRHLRHVRRLLARVRGWLRRFRGVKSVYLDNYLAWHALIDRAGRSDRRIEQVLYWPFAPPDSETRRRPPTGPAHSGRCARTLE